MLIKIFLCLFASCDLRGLVRRADQCFSDDLDLFCILLGIFGDLKNLLCYNTLKVTSMTFKGDCVSGKCP